MKSLLLLVVTIFSSLLYTNVANSQNTSNCSAELTVVNNWNKQSAYPEKGASFSLELKNTSYQTTTFKLSKEFLKTSCANKHNKSTLPNTEVGVSFQFDNTAKKNANNEITLKAGEVLKFEVKINNPKGTPLKSWSCIEIIANANNCKNEIATTTLGVYMADPADGY